MNKAPHQAERFRIVKGAYKSDESDGNNGAFIIPGPKGKDLHCIVSDGEGWEHVSVSTKKRCPNWDEMCFIKDIFWSEEECVIQYHPPKSEYVNNHQYCLHLWKNLEQDIPLPPRTFV